MSVTFGELTRKTLLALVNDRTVTPPLTVDGINVLLVEEGINEACHAIARVHDFEELIVLDTTSAATVDGTKRYHLTTDLLLTRPKHIYSIVLHDDSNSRKLTPVPYAELDDKVPYPEQLGEQKPKWYTRQGDYLEFIPIPDAAYDLYIRYSQWPLTLTEAADICSYTQLTGQIVALAKDFVLSALSGNLLDSTTRAKAYLKLDVSDERRQSDTPRVARPFNPFTSSQVSNEYWKDPFVRR